MDPDPMDFTMDGSHQLQPNNPPQCQRFQPTYPSSSPSFTRDSYNLGPRDPHMYDPVHDSDSWLLGRAGPHFAGSHNASSSWGSGFGPSFNQLGSWNGFGDMQNGSQSGDIYRSHPGFMGRTSTYMGNEPRNPNNFMSHAAMRRDRGPPAAPNASSARDTLGQTPLHPSTLMQHPETGNSPFGHFNAQSYLAGLDGYNSYSNTRSSVERISSAASRAARNEIRTGIPPYSPQSAENIARVNAAQAAHAHPSHSSPPRRRHSDWDDDDDEDELEIPAAMRSMYRHYQDMHAAYRGKQPTVPSKAALDALEKVNIIDLEDKCCPICYDEIGIQNADGVIEQPIRLPKCKHVFGDKCLDTWFKENDTCPYCRDKLPSDTSKKKMFASEQMRLFREHREFRDRLEAQAMERARRSNDSIQESYTRSSSRLNQEENRRLNEHVDPFSYSPPGNRFSTRDSPEYRRRAARGRAGLGRPNSNIFRNFSNQQAPTQRMSFQGSVPATTQTRPKTPPSLNASPGSSPSSFVSDGSEQASPPVAVGSGTSTHRPVSFSGHSFSGHSSARFDVSGGVGHHFAQGRGNGPSFGAGNNIQGQIIPLPSGVLRLPTGNTRSGPNHVVNQPSTRADDTSGNDLSFFGH